MSAFQDGDHAVLTCHDRTKIVQIRQGRPIFIDKNKIFLDHVIGQCDGSYFELKGKYLSVADMNQAKELAQAEDISSDNAGQDNRDLCDDGTGNQTLQHDEIEQLKSDGVSGQEIISKLVSKSATFEKKTAFSQQKYLNKKKKKYIQIYRTWKPSIRLLCQAYTNDLQKIMYLRRDTLAMLLSLSNISHGSNVGIVESCQGLVLASAIQRCAGGNGFIFNLTPAGENNSTSPCCDFMDFPDEYKANVYSIPIENVGDLNTIERANQAKPVEKEPNEKHLLAMQRRQRRLDGLQLFEKTKLDSLIIASKYDSLSILQHLIDYLTLSSHFVIYSQSNETLLECYQFLKKRGGTIHVEIADSWLREYQILDERTHPFIRMSGASGYLLSGMIVQS
ncbi:unnamed protein product [Rotaria socialis]|uniref:tRNA (adenine(58)-N(1))-methyltransferase non-catalytic subunit TRM6 n=1 Tax=Rotaria socialis TaxID=392032 RepID=A0A818GEK5_9BILA|nr:unnamed protein product [Rotaria socialis]CAF3279677.1 unnamed protein product [Rotaria socialis]CAF3372554.1 unnamed protein product [Rotaria socialis]CAF3488631.1 unnamed protein product [Rotaria socialis]CAF3639133.1 unnamed protein product [Rotaria socialis]